MGVSQDQELADGLKKIEKNKKKINRTFYEGGIDDPKVIAAALKPRQMGAMALLRRYLARI